MTVRLPKWLLLVTGGLAVSILAVVAVVALSGGDSESEEEDCVSRQTGNPIPCEQELIAIPADEYEAELESRPDADEINAALDKITRTCIDLSFDLGKPGDETEVGLAVDDLIRNYELGPNEPVDLGASSKLETPREALQGAVRFLENDCSPADAQRAHDALSTTP